MQIVLAPEELARFTDKVDDWHEDRFTFLLNNVSKFIQTDEDQQKLMADLDQFQRDKPKPLTWRELLIQE